MVESKNERPTVPDVLPIVNAYYAKPGNSVGGSLHVVLEDENTDDASVAFCLEYAREHGDDDGIRIAEMLLVMSRTQRNKIARLKRAPALPFPQL